MSTEMKIGDSVQLKAGGPKMSVMAIAPGLIICAWFVNNEFKSAPFVPDTLQPWVEPVPPPPLPEVPMKFKNGDKVKLGEGPVMIVHNLQCAGHRDGWIEASWFDGKNRKIERFQQDSLTLVI